MSNQVTLREFKSHELLFDVAETRAHLRVEGRCGAGQPRVVLMMKKLLYVAIVLLVAVLLFTHFSLSRMDAQRLVACAATNDASRIPSPVCMFYLEHFTGSEDAEQLEAGPGLAYAFGIDEPHTRRAVMERLLEIGVDINAPSGIDGLTPINAAILLNDAELIGFLLARGANVQAADAHGRDADDYLALLREKDEMTDRSALSAVLQRDTARE